ncbi:hypothetical protein PTSG_06395 [Salpingoeca rosetta]|uniref:BSD domain-containing protein n=1 Tax=Salpingoeca rosetta (strain ATCC 50818 / BSB-021) TaxID=946362 RepID=F2UCS7_SALR5|nr:uncharacterized protein PTSG_06395 [Salpingoeca rosetta]EGD74384.1 hypothetical protein PTSG_06395 [Salpingoeca rosetta]|eukprot:XP_004993284.1 hypothetical protein PTSG_06395 [Salpingoeca rosetta]
MSYDFLQDFHLHYGEKVLKHFDVRKGDRDGFFVVTNKRFAWQKKGALHPEVSIAARDLKRRPRKISSAAGMKMTVSIAARDLKRRPRKISSAAGMKMTLTTVDQHEYTFRFLAGTPTEAAAARDEAIKLIVEVYNSSSKQSMEQEHLHSALAEDESKESLETVEARLKEDERKKSQELKRKKAALLERNPLLKELFIVGVKKKKFIKESLFWETFKDELGRSSKASSYEKGQHLGISSGLLSQYVRLESSDGQRNEIQLSTNVIKGIFKLYPAVEDAYKQHVLSKQIPESLFWKKVWFSPIFQRGSLNKHSIQTKDMFSDLGEKQDEIRAHLDVALSNPLNDISMNDAVHDEEEASGHVVMKELKSSRQAPLKRRRRNIALLNDDSTKILTLMGATSAAAALTHGSSSSSSSSSSRRGGDGDGAKRSGRDVKDDELGAGIGGGGGHGGSLEMQAEQIQKRLKEATEYDDLQGEVKHVRTAPLHLREEYRTPQAMKADVDEVPAVPASVSLQCRPVHTSGDAALAVAQEFATQSQDECIAIMQYEEAFETLLREYWLSVSEETKGPHRSEATAQQAAKLLYKYKRVKLEPFMSSANAHTRALLEVLADRVDRALTHAQSTHA